ncbi:MAG: T9SS type A sorting domain-containing protein, partial [Bacteroidota bacterium]
ETPNWINDRGNANYIQDLGNSTIRINGLSGTEFALGGEDGSVPIRLLSFEAFPEAPQSILLRWETLYETNNQQFEIERSADARHFEKIGSRDGGGNSNRLRTYTFRDEQPLTGFNYYRLKQIDFDGQFEYSPVLVVIWERNVFEEIQLYPNPTQESILLKLPEKPNQMGNIRLLNLQGNTIYESSYSAEDQELAIDLKSIPAGIYLLEFNYLNRIIRRKLIKIN